MKLSNTQYSEMYKEASRGTQWWVTIPKAFVIGGLICCIGQALINMYSAWGLDEKNAATATTITLIGLSALFTGLGLYEKLAKHGGAGTLVPVTGFANSVVAPAIEFKTEGWVLGLGAKIFIISGPVILYGTLAGVVYGILCFVGLG